MDLLCPICASPLYTKDKMYKCENNHSYDTAKEGYVNLLPINKKNSKNPGDNKEMISARREFLTAGYYDRLAKQISLLIDPKTETLVDLGCGEGYYSRYINTQIPTINILGIDISKEAIKRAAKSHPKGKYAVASVNDIPLAEGRANTILTVFAPLNSTEIDRILSAEGKLIVVSAAANHMKEIASKIYQKTKPHSYNPLEHLQERFTQIELVNVSFTLTLPTEKDIIAMLKMTPYYWSADDKSIRSIVANYDMPISCDFNIQLFKKK